MFLAQFLQKKKQIDLTWLSCVNQQAFIKIHSLLISNPVCRFASFDSCIRRPLCPHTTALLAGITSVLGCRFNGGKGILMSCTENLSDFIQAEGLLTSSPTAGARSYYLLVTGTPTLCLCASRLSLICLSSSMYLLSKGVGSEGEEQHLDTKQPSKSRLS